MGDSLVPLDYYEAADSDAPTLVDDLAPETPSTEGKKSKKAKKVAAVGYSTKDFWDSLVAKLLAEDHTQDLPSKLLSAELAPGAPVPLKQLDTRVLSQYSLKHKRCQVLVLASSALRALEIIRSLETHRKKYRIGKLFAKHIKLQQQIDLLRKNSVPVAVGTPSRTLALLKETDLLNEVVCLVIDSAKDVKTRTIIHMTETCAPLLGIITAFKERLVARKCRILLIE